MLCLLKVLNHWLWNRKLGHASWRLISKLQKNNLARGLPNMSYKDDLLYDACQKGKQIKNFFTSKNIVSTSRPLQLLHLHLFGLTRTASASGKRYGLVIVEDYSRRTWVMFLNHKDESFDIFFKFHKHVESEKKEYALLQSEVIMRENLKMRGFNYLVKKMESFTIFNTKNTSTKWGS